MCQVREPSDGLTVDAQSNMCELKSQPFGRSMLGEGPDPPKRDALLCSDYWPHGVEGRPASFEMSTWRVQDSDTCQDTLLVSPFMQVSRRSGFQTAPDHTRQRKVENRACRASGGGGERMFKVDVATLCLFCCSFGISGPVRVCPWANVSTFADRPLCAGEYSTVDRVRGTGKNAYRDLRSRQCRCGRQFYRCNLLSARR